ncbi:ATP-binding protein [Desulfothermus naphthae]
MTQTPKKIPYGIADAAEVLSDKYYYVDKTHFIPVLENAGRHIVVLRPRRFGKSLLISTLELYYDINRKHRFQEFFKDTWIGKNPTELQGSFLVIRFNFSAVRADPELVEEDFNLYIKEVIGSYVRYYEKFIPRDIFERILCCENGPDMLRVLLSQEFYRKTRHKIYILIDEYDNFANAILSAYSHEEYMQLTHGGGFFKDFFKKLKAATEESESSLAKLFITGVSPITLDDVTSGFNIGENLSLDPRLSTLFGFTEKEVATIYEYYTSLNLLNIDKDEFFKIISAWYNGYSFNEDTTERVYNPDMIFYFLKQIMALKKLPRDLIDENVRIDYAKMRHLITVDRKVKTFNGNFSILKQIIENGIAGGRVVKTFPLERLTHPQNFTSHLFYLGLLSFNGDDELIIPNETVNQLLYEHLRDAYEDTGIFRSNLYFLAEKIKKMAYSGEWKGVFEQLSSEINTQTSIRDYLQGEQTIKTFLAAYISITDYFIVHLERELNKGFADLYLKPFYEKNQKVRFGYLIEIKYIPRGEKLTENILNKKRDEAKAQLLKYAQDDIISRKSHTKLKLIYQIWHGWELVEMEEI